MQAEPLCDMTASREVPLTSSYLLQFFVIRARYRFLVLRGPSGAGKTSWARFITGDLSRVLDVNTAATPEPGLRLYQRGVHQYIVGDEATPQMVPAEMKLFQSSAPTVQLGAIKGTASSWQVFVSGMRFILCSRTWMGQVDLLLLADEV